jgi:ribosomal protein L37AE/L43A
VSVFDIPNAEAIPANLSRTFQDLRSMRRKSSYRVAQEMRASSFPVCPKAYHIFRRTPQEKRPIFEESFISDAATLLGTSLHLVLQKWFAVQGYLYGDWVCVHCRKIRRQATGMQLCAKCGREMIYREFEVTKTAETPFSGHIDGLLRLHDANYVIDFKGSNPDAMRDIRNSGKPKEQHYLQVNAYANAVNLHPEAYGNIGEVTKLIIIYIDRSMPHRLWHPVKVPVSQKIYRETVGRIKLAFQSLDDMVVPRGLCLKPSDPYAKYCPWKQICFSPALDGMLSDQVVPEGSSKPSHSERELLMLASYLEPGIKLGS